MKIHRHCTARTNIYNNSIDIQVNNPLTMWYSTLQMNIGWILLYIQGHACAAMDKFSMDINMQMIRIYYDDIIQENRYKSYNIDNKNMFRA